MLYGWKRKMRNKDYKIVKIILKFFYKILFFHFEKIILPERVDFEN